MCDNILIMHVSMLDEGSGTRGMKTLIREIYWTDKLKNEGNYQILLVNINESLEYAAGRVVI